MVIEVSLNRIGMMVTYVKRGFHCHAAKTVKPFVRLYYDEKEV